MPLARLHRARTPRSLAPLVLLVLSAAPLACGSPSTNDVEIGRQLYLSRGCASCHGEDGSGTGAAAASLPRPPRNLHRAETFVRGASSERIARTIEDGILDGGMPAAPYLPAEERRLIALYVESLAAGAAGTGKD